MKKVRSLLNLDLNLSLHSQGGFTLIEVLLAVSLVALMATLVFGSLYVTTSAIDVARANSANEQIVRSTMRVMIDELSVAKESPVGRWMGVNGLFDGQPADSVAFLTVGQFRGSDSAKDSELVRIVYTREGATARFVRKVSTVLDELSSGWSWPARSKFNVRYYDGKPICGWIVEWRCAGVPKRVA
jgi:general secretion pathway protein J